MQIESLAPHRRAGASKDALPAATPASSPQAVAEINAYIAIRDELFAEAEQLRTTAKLDSASAANDFVAQCLRPARPPYQAQSLSESDACRERKRCEFVTGRIAQLRVLIGAAPQMRGRFA